jgi:hypothetical protein
MAPLAVSQWGWRPARPALQAVPHMSLSASIAPTRRLAEQRSPNDLLNLSGWGFAPPPKRTPKRTRRSPGPSAQPPFASHPCRRPWPLRFCRTCRTACAAVPSPLRAPAPAARRVACCGKSRGQHGLSCANRLGACARVPHACLQVSMEAPTDVMGGKQRGASHSVLIIEKKLGAGAQVPWCSAGCPAHCSAGCRTWLRDV